MALLSSHWSAGVRSLVAGIEGGAVKEVKEVCGGLGSARIGGWRVRRWNDSSSRGGFGLVPAGLLRCQGAKGCGKAGRFGRVRGEVYGGGVGHGWFGSRVRMNGGGAMGREEVSVGRYEEGDGLYDKFLEHAVRTVWQREDLSPLPCQDEFKNMIAVDGQAVIENVAFESTKFRLFRCATINGGDNMQVLNVAICARPEYDLPIFCADFFSTATRNIVVLDLNPLYNTEQRPEYRDKYFSQILQLGNKYSELLPWGDKLTAESIQFFSPVVIWTRPESREDIQGTVFSAFKDYLAAWLDMADRAASSKDAVEIAENQESHHRYLMWRATKDPGRYVLMRLYGEALCERYINEFLFNGVRTLGTKQFLDYFPEYRGADGSVIKQRSMVGKAFEERPWNKEGVFSPSR